MRWLDGQDKQPAIEAIPSEIRIHAGLCLWFTQFGF